MEYKLAWKNSIPQALFVQRSAHTLNLVIFRELQKLEECNCFLQIWEDCLHFFFLHVLLNGLKYRMNFVSIKAATCLTSEVELGWAVSAHPWPCRGFWPWYIVHQDTWEIWLLFFFFHLAFIGTLDFADVFIGILQTKSLDVQFSVARIAEFGQGLEGERGKCNAFFERTVEAVGQPGAPRGRPDPHVHYIELHTAVIHSILT